MPNKERGYLMHPLELFSRLRRWLSWVLPSHQLLVPHPEQVTLISLLTGS